jgi:hypothetical protein
VSEYAQPLHDVWDDQIGAPVPETEYPAWLREMAGWLRINHLEDGSGEWLLRCRACDLALGIDPRVARRLPIGPGLAQSILQLGRHGIQHAIDGELPWLSEQHGR